MLSPKLGSSPAAERHEVREATNAIVVCVPERLRVVVAVAVRAEDGRPLGGRRIDSTSAVRARVASINEVLIPSPVAGGAASPVLRALNVEPNHGGP